MRRVAEVIRETFGTHYHLQPSLATTNRVRMEFLEARASGLGKGRGGAKTLAEETLNGNQRKPRYLEPIWLFSTKVGFCSSPMYTGLRRRGKRFLTCTISISTGEIESRSSPASQFLPSGDIGGFTSDSKGRISRPRMWPSLCTIFCSTSMGISSSYVAKLTSIEKIGPYPFQSLPKAPVEWVPGYPSELNPVEFVWTQDKRRLANSSPEGVNEPKRMLIGPARRLQHSQRLLWSRIYVSKPAWKR